MLLLMQRYEIKRKLSNKYAYKYIFIIEMVKCIDMADNYCIFAVCHGTVSDIYGVDNMDDKE